MRRDPSLQFVELSETRAQIMLNCRLFFWRVLFSCRPRRAPFVTCRQLTVSVKFVRWRLAGRSSVVRALDLEG